VLERYDLAVARGARLYGEIVGHGSSSVADQRRVAKRDVALANVMRMALRSAGITPDQVGHVHAHGLSTRRCDAEEARAIRQVFGDAADRVPVTAAKSYFGNLGAASGVVELIASLLAMQQGPLFPCLNYETPDPDCPVRVAHDHDTAAGDNVLNLSVTPQGQATALVVRKVAE
jgi:3-oxoacyl-[acyl-carrier-protein] synthase II